MKMMTEKEIMEMKRKDKEVQAESLKFLNVDENKRDKYGLICIQDLSERIKNIILHRFPSELRGRGDPRHYYSLYVEVIGIEKNFQINQGNKSELNKNIFWYDDITELYFHKLDDEGFPIY